MVTVLRNVHVFDGESFGGTTDLAFSDGVVIDRAGAEDPAAGAVGVVDGGGGYVLPGFIDCHVHLYGPETLGELARHGVTTGLDMSSPPPLVQALRGTPGVADLRSPMMALSDPSSAHAQRMKDIPAAAECFVSNVAEAREAVARRVDQGADYIKVVIDLPGFDEETVTAIVDEAHRRGLRAIAHASRSDAVELAMRAGIDVLTHAPLDRAITPEQAATLATAETIVVPTLTMMKGIVERIGTPGGPGPRYEAAAESVRNLHRAGVPVLVGTDANQTPAAPFSPVMGESLHDELELLVAAGLSPAEALRGATSEAADRFGLTDRGRLDPGARADLVLLGADPTQDIGASRSIRGVWVAGAHVVTPS